jgi:hypothetical protein
MRDGFYTPVESGAEAKTLRVSVPGKGEQEFKVAEYTNFTVREVLVFSLGKNEGFQVQIDGNSRQALWKKDVIAMVVDGKPYFEMSRVGGEDATNGFYIPASIALRVASKAEADKILERLSRRYHCPAHKY